MKKLLGIALGIVTSIGGFLDAGSIATSAQAGAAFGYALLWALALGTVCVIFLVEMSGRFAIASGHTITDAIRKRFGFAALIVPFAATMLVNLLVLASEVGGVCVALELVTGIGFQLWAIPVALALKPQGIRVEGYEQAALMLVPAFGRWGFYLFVVSLAVACFGAALELSLASAYAMAQTFGWNWGENLRPRQAARFSFVYTAFLALAALIVLTGLNPMKLTLFSMAITAVILPLTAMPFLVLMNDRRYMGEHVNSRFANMVVALIVLLAAVLALVSIPLEILGSK